MLVALPFILRSLALLVISSALLLTPVTSEAGSDVASGLKKSGDRSFKSKRNLLTNHPARNGDGTINVVIEIPAGTNQKWEVSEDGKSLDWELTGDKPRIIDYLPYPGNYGMVPRTWLDPEKGGDNQPLDVMVLGPAVPRGTVVRATPIGVIRVIDRFEQDDKILAIDVGSSFQGVTDIESLDDRYPGASEILRLWFGNAHGTSQVQLLGTGSRAQANSIIDYAADLFKKQNVKDRPVKD